MSAGAVYDAQDVRQSAHATDVERLVIELADAMADTPSNVSEDLFARLRDHFSEEQLLELGTQIAFENYRARLTGSSMWRGINYMHPTARARPRVRVDVLV